MIRKSLCLLMLGFLMGGVSMVAQSGYNDFVPVGPTPIDFKIHDGRLFSEVTIDEANNELVINLLPNELAHKSVITIDKDENLEITALEMSLRKYHYVVTTDYIKYTTLPVKRENVDGQVVGMARVGVGVRVVASFYANKRDITVTDLFALGLAARDGDIQGHITMSIMGIESEELTSRFPVNAEISPTSVSDALQALVSYQQAIYDPQAHLTPQVLEIKYTSEFRDEIQNVSDLQMPIVLPNRGESLVIIK